MTPGRLKTVRLLLVIGAIFIAAFTIWNSFTLAIAASDPQLALSYRSALPEARVERAISLLTDSNDKDAPGLSRADSLAALRESPVVRGALGTLTMTIMELGNTGKAQEISRLLPALGHRDRLGNLALLKLKADNHDLYEMIGQADIVLRTSPIDGIPVTKALGEEAREPDFAAMLATRLATRPPWRLMFLQTIESNPQQADAAWQVLAHLKATSAPPTSEEVAPYFWISGRQLDPLTARARWDMFFGNLANPDRTAINDGGFEGKSGPPPFAWYLPQGGHIAAALRPYPAGSNGHALFADYDGIGEALLTTQQTLFRPGTGFLSFKALLDEGDDKQRALVTLTCIGSGINAGRQRFIVQQSAHIFRVQFRVPDRNCPSQRLDFWGQPNLAQSAVTYVFDDVAFSATRVRQEPGS
jgi:hypothetical protein